MFFKKSILLGSAIALTTLSFTANAFLHTENYARQDSTVKITSNLNICAAMVPPFKFTPASVDGVTPGQSNANSGEIKALCNHDPCVAQIFMNKTCTGSPIATATLTGVGTDTHIVTQITMIDTHYDVTGLNTSNVTIRAVK